MRITDLILVPALILGATTSANADNTLVLGLLNIEDAQQIPYATAMNKLERGLTKQHCQLVREGQVLGSDGNLLKQDYSRFFLIQCRQSLLGNPTRFTLFGFSLVDNHNLVLLEGRSNEAKFPSTKEISERLYVIKLGRYNNLDPLSRFNDLDAANELAGTRSPTYRNEAFFFVDTAVGIERPDEVTILYYPSPGAARQFRSDNGDVLKRIGKFNSDHLNGFNYINAKSNR